MRFAEAVRVLGQAARRRRARPCPGSAARPGWPAPSARSRRHRGGGATVAVTIRERPFQAVVADMIEGIVVANQLDGTAATRARTALWEALVGRGERQLTGLTYRWRARHARVAESADAEGLNPSGASAPCGFEPRPGHCDQRGSATNGVDGGELMAILLTRC